MDSVTPKIGDVWYQYKDVMYAASLNEYDEPSGPSILKVEMHRWLVVKVNPKSVWAVRIFGATPNENSVIHKFSPGELKMYAVLMMLNSKRRPAHPTKAEALKGFLAKKRRQAAIATAKVNRAERAMIMAKRMYEDDDGEI